MKFGKEFASQMVPEWQEAYMDYDYLKTLLKEIQIFKQKNRAPPQAQPSSSSSALMRKLTLYRAFSGLTHRTQTHAPDIEDQQPILVNPVKKDGDKVEGSETLFLMAAEEGGEYEMVYFRRLDDEFNKVVRFFKGKVEEVMEEAEMLNKQMDALIAFRVRVENPQGRVDWSGEMTRLASGIASSAAALSASTPSGAKAGGRAPMEIIQEDEPNSTEESDESSHGKEMKTMNQPVKQHKSENIRGARPAPLEVLNHVKMNNTLETPRSTIKGLLHDSTETELKFSRANLRKVEEQLKKAFGEFYQKIRLLKSFNFLNVLAFSKIMKKYDKVSGRNAARSYMKMVDNSYLGSCDEITKLMERAEATFIKHFCNSNRRKGMAILRPKAKKERHRTTFSLGFLAGCAFALYLALILVVRTRQLLGSPGRLRYMETMFPLYSLFGFIFLHMVMYAANIFFWRRYRVNYTFIFGFKEGTELGYREVFLLSFGLAVLALASVHANLDMEMDTNTSNFKAVTELLPLGLLVLVVAILICPLNIIYRSSRFFLLTCIFHCICAPLYKVLLPDFFLADQLTSQVQAFRNLEFYICYYGWGDYKRRESNCHDYVVFEVFYYIVAAIPFWVRFLQCLRRLYEEKDPMQGYNGLKYFATIVALCMRTAYRFNQGFTWRLMAGISSAIATIVATYWDTVIDWGLLNRNSKNRWLRDKLLVPHKIVYFSAMVLNVLLRFAWMQSVLNFKIRFLHTETVAAILAGLEIIRRGIWNFFRLENEHLNNVGKYRAFKTVPLPFNYDEDDDKDE